jgi:hypothetical protein
MNCWNCDRPAHGVCKFCGRAVCKDHVRTLPAILGMFRADDGSLQALVEPEAVHCGTCQPRGRPVKLDGLEAWIKTKDGS